MKLYLSYFPEILSQLRKISSVVTLRNEGYLLSCCYQKLVLFLCFFIYSSLLSTLLLVNFPALKKCLKAVLLLISVFATVNNGNFHLASSTLLDDILNTLCRMLSV